ncbi:MAG: hypothetical protein ACJA1A_000530 [Saprospiraceae bacterium]|jgi:hypothetical protein
MIHFMLPFLVGMKLFTEEIPKPHDSYREGLVCLIMDIVDTYDILLKVGLPKLS